MNSSSSTAHRPSLFAKAGEGSASSDHPIETHRILDILQDKSAPPPMQRQIRLWLIGGVAVFLLVAGVVFYNWQKTPESDVIAEQALQAEVKKIQLDNSSAHLPTSAVPGVTTPASLPSAEAPLEPARIESSATPDAAPPSQAEASATTAHNPFQELAPVAATTPMAQANATKPAVGSHVIPPRASIGNSQPNSAVVSKMPALPSHRHTENTVAKNKTGRPQADDDVDLIEAVVARVDGHSPGNKAANAKSYASNRVTATPVPPPAPPVMRTGKSDRNASPTTRDNLAEQVQRCAAIGGLEGLLCRHRVCSTHWGKDAACPASKPSRIHEADRLGPN